MNDKGVVALYMIMVAVVIVIMALALSPVVKTFVDTARQNSTEDVQGLDCTNTTLMNNETTGRFATANCIATDLFTPMFLGILMAVAGAIIGAKLIIGEA